MIYWYHEPIKQQKSGATNHKLKEVRGMGTTTLVLTIAAIIGMHTLGLGTAIFSFTDNPQWAKWIVCAASTLIILVICVTTVIMLLNAD